MNSKRAARHGRSWRISRRSQPGAMPGTLVADPDAPPPRIHLIAYGPDRIVEHAACSIEQITVARGRMPVLWVDVEGLGDIALIEQIGAAFGLHPLALEDVVNVHQRPKAEPYEDHVFIVTRMVLPGDLSGETEQVGMFLGRDYLLTFQEGHAGDCFEPVRERLRQAKGRIRGLGPDYLAYALIDAVVDGYFPLLEAYGERLEQIEDLVIAAPEPAVNHGLHKLKRKLLGIRRRIWPHRELLNSLIRDETPLVTAPTRLFLRDCYDHTIQLMDLVETYREIASGLVDVYLSSLSARMNEIMKVLTIIATIFIPLGFIAGVYGMNFDPDISLWNMPELRWPLGYPFALALMALTAGGLLLWFRRRGWVGRPRRRAAIFKP
jgi:magnesium transporter